METVGQNEIPFVVLPFTGVDYVELVQSIDFQQRSVTVFGKTHPQPRLTKWYGAVPYLYSGLEWEACPMPPLVEQIRQRVEGAASERFNSVLCNHYRNGADCVGWHSDDEPLFGGDPIVASLSFGATRTFRLRRKDAHRATHSIDLRDGTLLVMGRGVQRGWDHCVPRTKKPVDGRINLTFRKTVRAS